LLTSVSPSGRGKTNYFMPVLELIFLYVNIQGNLVGIVPSL